jgi:hypothetical protein
MNPLAAKATTFYTMVPNIIISSLGLNLEHVDYEISLFIFGLQNGFRNLGREASLERTEGWWRHITSK